MFVPWPTVPTIPAGCMHRAKHSHTSLNQTALQLVELVRVICLTHFAGCNIALFRQTIGKCCLVAGKIRCIVANKITQLGCGPGTRTASLQSPASSGFVGRDHIPRKYRAAVSCSATSVRTAICERVTPRLYPKRRGLRLYFDRWADFVAGAKSFV